MLRQIKLIADILGGGFSLTTTIQSYAVNFATRATPVAMSVGWVEIVDGTEVPIGRYLDIPILASLPTVSEVEGLLEQAPQKAFQPMIDKVYEVLLNDNDYQWRSISGLSSSTGIPEDELQKLIQNHIGDGVLVRNPANLNMVGHRKKVSL